MKTVTGIFLLALLLCNMLGLSLAELCFESSYKNATLKVTNAETETLKIYLPSIPYAAPLETIDVRNELLRIEGRFYNTVQYVHRNDTLYVTVIVDVSAHQRFAELSEMVREVYDQPSDTESRSSGRLIKSLNDLMKIYLPAGSHFVCNKQLLPASDRKIFFGYLHCKLRSPAKTPNFPPPENFSFPV